MQGSLHLFDHKYRNHTRIASSTPCLCLVPPNARRTVVRCTSCLTLPALKNRPGFLPRSKSVLTDRAYPTRDVLAWSRDMFQTTAPSANGPGRWERSDPANAARRVVCHEHEPACRTGRSRLPVSPLTTHRSPITPFLTLTISLHSDGAFPTIDRGPKIWRNLIDICRLEMDAND
jgi:hypothetical protein